MISKDVPRSCEEARGGNWSGDGGGGHGVPVDEGDVVVECVLFLHRLPLATAGVPVAGHQTNIPLNLVKLYLITILYFSCNEGT